MDGTKNRERHLAWGPSDIEMLPRTSVTHPLQIAEVQVSPRHGKVGLTFAPGKHQPDGMSGGWKRDLAADLDVIAAWNAAAVVTLVED